MRFKRVFTIVMDSVGCGEMPDSDKYGDKGANTIKHISESVNGINLPVLEQLGYGNLTEIKGVKKTKPLAYVAKMMELSNGKDTMTGHWEMMGLRTIKPFITFTETGFPQELLDILEEKSGHKMIGNCAASGTEIIKELGEHHLKTGDLILYTSADSVLQIAANEEIVPLKELYDICKMAREVTLKDEWKVGRVIARPFIGKTKETFKRTANRHDYALKPFQKTVLNSLKDSSYDVISVGKISDIFDGEGITESNKITSNEDGMIKTLEIAKRDFTGLCFVNLVDFDALYGHRRDPKGYAQCLESFDSDLGKLIEILKEDDLLIITADHGNDPTWSGSDHTRECVPLIVYNKKLSGGILDIRKTFADIGASISENFNVKRPVIGESFLNDLK